MRAMQMVVGLVALLALTAPVSALYENVEFTPVIVDPADFAGFHDILSIALGEPGDDTVVVRTEPADISVAVPSGSIDFWSTAPGADIRASANQDGSAGGDYTACSVDGAYMFCVLPYATLGAVIGDQLTENYAISYIGTVMDYAPGGIGVQEILIGGVGDDYTIIGSTVVGGGAVTGPSVFHENLTTTDMIVTKEATEPFDAVFNYNWTEGKQAMDLSINATVANGTATLTIFDAAGTELYSAMTSENMTAMESFTDAEAGNWTVTLALEAFVGMYHFELMETSEAIEVPNPSGNPEPSGSAEPSNTANPSSSTMPSESTGPVDNSTTDDDKDSPSVAPIVLVVGLVAIAAIVRRRL